MPLGAIAGGLASGAAGSLLSGGGDSGVGTSPFYPAFATSGLATVGASGGNEYLPGQVNIDLSPEYQALQNQLLGQAGAFFGTTPTISPSLTGAGTAASQAAQGAFGALTTFDPAQATAEQYALQQQLLQPTQQQEQLALEERLYQQGLLGGTSGANQQQALYEAQNLANLQSMLEAQTAAQQQQQNLASLGTSAGAFGAGMAQLPLQLAGQQLGLGTTALGATLAPQELALQQAQLTSMIQPSTYTYTPQQTTGQGIGAGLTSAGADLLSSGIQGLFTQ